MSKLQLPWRIWTDFSFRVEEVTVFAICPVQQWADAHTPSRWRTTAGLVRGGWGASSSAPRTIWKSRTRARRRAPPGSLRSLDWDWTGELRPFKGQTAAPVAEVPHCLFIFWFCIWWFGLSKRIKVNLRQRFFLKSWRGNILGSLKESSLCEIIWILQNQIPSGLWRPEVRYEGSKMWDFSSSLKWCNALTLF